MAQRIIYTCDKCGIEVDNPNRMMIQNMGSKYMNCSIDLCDNCAETFVADTINFLSTACPTAEVHSYLDIPQYEKTLVENEKQEESNDQQSTDVIDSVVYNKKEDVE